MLGGAKLTIYDYTNNSAVYEDTANANTNFKYVICIDSSTCIAADDSTSQFNYYKMTASDFLGPTDSITTYSISDTSTGPTNSMAVIASQSVIYISRAFTIFMLQMGYVSSFKKIKFASQVNSLRISQVTVGI